MSYLENSMKIFKISTNVLLLYYNINPYKHGYTVTSENIQTPSHFIVLKILY